MKTFTGRCLRITGSLFLCLSGEAPAQVITARFIYTRLAWRLYRRTRGPGFSGICAFLGRRQEFTR